MNTTEKPAEAGPVDAWVRPLVELRELAQEGAALHSEEMPERQVCDGLLWALAEIERLQAELDRLNEPGVCYSPCLGHQYHQYKVRWQASYAPALRSVCPICAGVAEDVTGPHLPVWPNG